MKSQLFDLHGRVAIVTGGNGGIGLGMARGLADAGADIAIVGRDEVKSSAAVADIGRRGVRAISVGDDVTDTNLTGAFLCSKAVYPAMKAAGGGKIINIGSMMSLFGASFAPAYAASKGGIVQLTRSCACAWAADNIQANAILPGWIDTDLTKRAREQIAGLHERVLGRTPAARWGEISDCAGIAVFLSSHASDFVTGAAIPVDGGFSIMG
jgi:2-deoxy-D-gluconate 3-dehydrogenase